jgi:hypothetical protein
MFTTRVDNGDHPKKTLFSITDVRDFNAFPILVSKLLEKYEEMYQSAAIGERVDSVILEPNIKSAFALNSAYSLFLQTMRCKNSMSKDQFKKCASHNRIKEKTIVSLDRMAHVQNIAPFMTGEIDSSHILDPDYCKKFSPDVTFRRIQIMIQLQGCLNMILQGVFIAVYGGSDSDD